MYLKPKNERPHLTVFGATFDLLKFVAVLAVGFLIGFLMLVNYLMQNDPLVVALVAFVSVGYMIRHR